MPILSPTTFLDLSRLGSDRASPTFGVSSDATQASGPSPFQRMLDRRSDEQLQRSQSDEATQSDATRQASGSQADDAARDASSREVKAQQASSDADRTPRSTQGATSGQRADSARKDARTNAQTDVKKGAKADGQATQQTRPAQGDKAQGSGDAQDAVADGVADPAATADAAPGADNADFQMAPSNHPVAGSPIALKKFLVCVAVLTAQI